jgi:hypothetical protein
MGLLTDFFIADRRELAKVFVGWLTVADQPVVREATNPFTGQSQRVQEWPPAGPIAPGKPARVIKLAALLHVQFKRIDHVKLATLAVMLTGTTFDEANDALAKPALVHPKNDETGLHQLPAALTVAVAELTDDRLRSVATAWSETDEMQADGFEPSDCEQVLQALRQLASSCKSEQSLYLLWNL